MYYSRYNFEVVRVASTDPFDRGLNGVYLDPDGSTVAGSGRMVLAVEGVSYGDKLAGVLGVSDKVVSGGLVAPL